MARKENPLADESSVGARMRLARRRRGLTLTELAAQIGYSKPYLSAVENGTSRPSRTIVTAYEHTLSLPPGDLGFPEAGSSAVATMTDSAGAPLLDTAVGGIATEFGLSSSELGMIRELLVDDARAKARAVRSSLDWWREPGPVPVCCIPVAGWQWREWPFARIVAAVDRGMAEAMQARIRDVVVVLPPEKIPEMEAAFRRAPFAERLQRITCVGQSAALGLGHAILQAQGTIGIRPFAVLLPDDQFDRLGSEPSVLRHLVDHYATGIDHLVAVAKLKGRGRQYGVARLEASAGRRAARAVSLLVEKPDAQHPVFRRDDQGDHSATYAVVGRYVLSPSIMTALSALGREADADPRVELLDGLQRLIDRQRESVAAYVLPSLVQLDRDQTVFVAGAPTSPSDAHVA